MAQRTPTQRQSMPRCARWEIRQDNFVSDSLPPHVHARRDALTFVTNEVEEIPSDGQDISTEIHDPSTVAHKKTPMWAGAKNTVLKNNDSFIKIEATWTIPNIYPPPDLWADSNTWNVDTGAKYTFTPMIRMANSTGNWDMRAGTSGELSVVNKTKLEQSEYAWVRFNGALLKFKNLEVKSGDVINAGLRYELVNNESQNIKATVTAVLINESSAAYTTYMQRLSYDDPLFVGGSAEWGILTRGRLPNFGTIFMYNCSATTSEREDRSVAYSDMFDLVQSGVRLATPVKVISNIVGIYYGGKSAAHQV